MLDCWYGLCASLICGWMRLTFAREEWDVGINFVPYVILDLGANDLDHVANPDPRIIADNIIKFAEKLSCAR